MNEKPAVSVTPNGGIKVVHAADRQENCISDDPDQFCQNIWISYPEFKGKTSVPLEPRTTLCWTLKWMDT